MTKTDIPSLKTFFLAHGAANKEERIVKPYLDQCFDMVTRWMLGRLPDGKRHLAVMIPPRHGKTYLARDVISYSLGLWPDCRFIYTSYAADLAVQQTAKIKAALNSDWYRKIFPWATEFKGTKDEYENSYGGTVYGVGFGGALTGFGAGLKRDAFGGAIIIDDPMKADEARSETVRQHVKDWYTGVLLSRRNNDDTPMMLIMQRLHPEDLVGHLKETMAEDWYFLEIPALITDADTLEPINTIWPETFSLKTAMQLKEVDPFAFYSQYMQTPIIPGGSIIKKEWWKTYSVEEERKNRTFSQWAIALTGDTAFKTKEANDYSAFQAWCFTPDRLLLLDGIYGKWEFHELQERAKEFYRKWALWQPNRRVEFYIEDKASGTPLCQVLNEAGVMTTPWLPKEFNFPDDKVSRMKASAIPVYAGHVFLPEGHPYSTALMDESAAFSSNDTHSHDDNCDAFTIAVSVWKWLGGNIE